VVHLEKHSSEKLCERVTAPIVHQLHNSEMFQHRAKTVNSPHNILACKIPLDQKEKEKKAREKGKKELEFLSF